MDSLVRLKQLNKPEVSGYVVDILNQYLTGGSIIIGSTGSLTEIFYPLYSNPSGYITGFNSGVFVLKNETGDFLTYTDTRYINAVLSAFDSRFSQITGSFTGFTGSYYPLNANPSGYLTPNQTGHFLSSGTNLDLANNNIYNIRSLNFYNGFSWDENNYLRDSDGYGKINLNTSILYGQDDYPSVDWKNHLLSNGEDNVLNWNQKILYGDWKVSGSFTVNDIDVVTGSVIRLADLIKTSGDLQSQINTFSGVTGIYYPLNNPSGYISSGKNIITQNKGFGAGIYTFQKKIAPSSNANVFSVSSRYGVQVFNVGIVCASQNFSVGKHLSVSKQVSGRPVATMTSNTGPYLGNDFSYNLSSSAGSGVILNVINSGVVTGDFLVTLFLCGSPQEVVVTEF